MNTIQGAPCRIEKILNSALSLLGIDGVTISYSSDRRVLSMFSVPDVDIKAVLMPSVVPHTYNLYGSRWLGKTELCHEMIHLSQYENGRLRRFENTLIWDGSPYDNATPYMERPWEIEAFKIQTQLIKHLINYDK